MGLPHHPMAPDRAADPIEVHVSYNPDHNPATTAGCTYVSVKDADVLAEEWGVVSGGSHVAPVVTDYGTREGAHIDPDGNLIRYGSRR